MPKHHPLIEQLRTLSALPSPPQVALKIVEVTRDTEKGAGDLADVLRNDAAISAKVLQVSNSTAYARSREITTLADAVNLLGVKSLSIISLGFSLKQSIPSFSLGGLDQDVLWKHSVATAVVARTLSRVLGQTDDEVAFMCGLMSRIGQLVFLSAIPDQYEPIVDSAARGLPTAAEELEILGVTHQHVARLLLDEWKLPSTICQAVECWGVQESDTEISEEAQLLANIVEVADTARSLLFDAEKASCLEKLYAVAQESCSLAPTEVDRVFLACQNELRETLTVFVDQASADVSCDAILSMAREQMVQVSVQLATDLSSMSHRCEQLSLTNHELKKQSTTDGLTGIANRFALDSELVKLDAICPAGKRRPYSIVMLDIDKFKSLNDTYGHDVGDQVLKAVGAALAEGARMTDFVARYGGEEFTVILPNCDETQAFAVAERFRVAVSSRGIELEDKTLFVTASAGVASSGNIDPGEDNGLVLKRADRALYTAKQNGRNQTVQFAPELCAELDSD